MNWTLDVDVYWIFHTFNIMISVELHFIIHNMSFVLHICTYTVYHMRPTHE